MRLFLTTLLLTTVCFGEGGTTVTKQAHQRELSKKQSKLIHKEPSKQDILKQNPNDEEVQHYFQNDLLRWIWNVPDYKKPQQKITIDTKESMAHVLKFIENLTKKPDIDKLKENPAAHQFVKDIFSSIKTQLVDGKAAPKGSKIIFNYKKYDDISGLFHKKEALLDKLNIILEDKTLNRTAH